MSTDFVRQVVEDARHAFNSGKTRPYTWRIGQLRALHTMIKDNSDVILAALKADLGKPMFEAWAAEIGVALRDIKEVMSALKGWMKPEKVSTPLVTQPGSARRYKDPLGVVLIIAPWNYPFNLVITHLIGAIAAGNAAVIKPSEISSNTSKMIADLLPRYVDNDAIKIVEGGVPETTALLVERFDHIFYTGNGHVARIIMGRRQALDASDLGIRREKPRLYKQNSGFKDNGTAGCLGQVHQRWSDVYRSGLRSH